MTEKQLTQLGWIATVTSCLMYISYIPQISNNLNGQPGNFLQPLVAAINCTLWVTYGLKKEKKDWPLAMANAPGIIFGLITFITAIR
ncbi:SemiSWEET family transporter [Vagococcus sp.]|uniref:SemiSWEET family transporter n=1 Tax=Vagococcus sp. TaxID=1933889 RepID=UPI003F99EFCF